MQALLSKLKFKLGSDHLIFAGDLISRGPSSSETIDLAMASQASCVRGNHEDRVLLAYRDMQIHHSLPPHPIKVSEGTEAAYPPEPGPNAKPAENKDGESFLSGDHVEQVLARSLSNEHVQYLASCPVILNIGPIQGLGEVRVVHAGLVPGVALRRQDPVSVMHMLTLDLATHVPSHVNDGTAWSKVRYALLFFTGTFSCHRKSVRILTAPRFGTNIRPFFPRRNAPPSFMAMTPGVVFNLANTPRG